MWFIFTIATTLIWGLAELFYKKGARPDEQYAHLKVCVCVGAVMGLHAVFTLLTKDIAYDPINLIRYLPVSMCYVLAMALSFFGMRFIEESISDPIENTSGAICFLMCVLLMGESFTPLSVTAVVMIAVGVMGVGILDNQGVTDRKKILGSRMARISFAMPFGYAILDACGTYLDIFYLDIQKSPLVGVTDATIEEVANTSYELSFFIVAVILMVFMKVKGVAFGRLPEQKDKIIAAVLETAGQFTYIFAMSGNGAIAAPIISSVCVVSLLLSRIVLKEKLTTRQYILLAMIICGILLLSEE